MSKVEIKLDFCDGTEYVLFPSCAYNGNKFNVLKKNYPPRFTVEEASVDMETTIPDVPRLNKDGSGKIQITTGDVATPCVGVFHKDKKKAVLVYTIQEIDNKNLGLGYETGKIEITYPALREQIYRWPRMHENTEEYVDIEAEIPYKTLEFDCESMEQFYEAYFKNRKIMGLDDTRADILSFEEQFEILKNKFNEMNWTGKYYAIGPEGNWQPGWCGGGISSYPLMKLGGELERERAIKTLEYMFENQAESGLMCDKDHIELTWPENQRTWVLTRQSGDCLYYLFKHFALMDTVPENFVSGTKKLADCFVTLWEKYGQFGQFIERTTGEIMAGGTVSGGVAPAGLVSAYKFFGDEKYLQVAKDSAEMMYKEYALKGYTTGGPGDMLQGPDSESAFGLLESLVCLYEETKEDKWLKYSEFMAHQCSSWVVSYNYKFPEGSEFNRLDMKTVGCVFANVQNKHAAPGICTHSGDCVYKLYKWTNNELYKELYDDISLTIGQYMSTDERPIYSWDVPKDASLLNDDSITAPREKLAQGYICERVNMSDWESFRCVGGVFNGSCWCETSNLLTLADRLGGEM